MRHALWGILRAALPLMLAALSLPAQLDPRLQASPTDFLDLYQPSANFRPKPEILSVLDVSLAMATLMAHPLYPNNDLWDQESFRSMAFGIEGSRRDLARGADQAAPPRPSVVLNAMVGSYVVPGIRYLSTPLSSALLIKPNGSPVTAADAEAVDASAPGSIRGSGSAYNWLRAASHVRMSASVEGVLRTVDVPIPWKLIDATSTGNPLRSRTVLDQQWKREGSRTTIHGSGAQVEMDTCYTVSDFLSAAGDDDLAVAQVSKWVRYRPAYVSWLFTAKFQNTDPTKPNYTTESALVGKFVVFDAADPSLAAGQGSVSWGQGFGPEGAWGPITVPIYNPDGSYAGTRRDEASNYRVPAMTRLQALKMAALKTWIAHQADVYWAYRCLDVSREAGGGAATSLDNDSHAAISGAELWGVGTYGSDSAWQVLNNTPAQGPNATQGNSAIGMARLARLVPTNERPLTYAMVRALAQFSDPSSVFNEVEGENVSPCGNAFLLLCSGGQDNQGIEGVSTTNLTTPYLASLDGTASIDIPAGNRALIERPGSLDRQGAFWNVPTFAAAAAHLADPAVGPLGVAHLAALGSARRMGPPSNFIPFAFPQRNGVTFPQVRRVTTMTLGVGLPGQLTDPVGPKRALFLAALLGDPGASSGTVAAYHPFRGWEQALGETVDPSNDWIPDPQDPTGYPQVGRGRPGAARFFDAMDPDSLCLATTFAFRMAMGAGAHQAATTPSLPYVGASLGRQLYVGRFTPPASGGVLWPGDLLSFATRQVNGRTQVLDRGGAPTGTLDATTALWSAADALARGPVGTARALFTRIPGGGALQPFKETGAAFTDPISGLANFVVTGMLDLTEKQRTIQHAAGADIHRLDPSGAPTAHRANLLGDIVNAAPAFVEYPWSRVSDQIRGFGDLATFGGDRFRLVLVGTNQGWLHAFGEVTRSDAQGVLRGVVQELWSFMPTDFLANLDYLKVDGNPHRFMVDGSPLIYHLDLPSGLGGVGNGLVDPGERVVGVFGLRKGGRSYYALDLSDPFHPSLRWSLVPDEGAAFPSTRNAVPGLALEDLRSLIQAMGFSTSTPAVGRVQDAHGALRDALFLGGGFSTPEVEANFGGQPLGRSVLALDVYTGEVLAAVDLTKEAGQGSPPGLGPIAAGLVPFEFVLNSGMAQRAYFLDHGGGLWAWGSKAVTSTAPYVNFRVDSAQLATWKIRKVFQDSDPNSHGQHYTTPPAPFRVGVFPGVGKAGSPSPAAVGVAMVSGDRHNPLDRAYDAINPAPLRHRLTVVFDRQDSRVWGLDTAAGPDAGITDAHLMDFTGNAATSTPNDPCASSLFQKITQGCPEYYLAPFSPSASGARTYLTPSFGYVVNFPMRAGIFVPKGIQAPLVVNGALFYSVFTPTEANPCSGGVGQTTSWVIADVLHPLVTDARPGRFLPSGRYFTWTGVASDFVNAGAGGVLQGGMVDQASSSGGVVVFPALASHPSASSPSFPKVRVWRTVR